MSKLVSITRYDEGDYTMDVDEDTTLEEKDSKCKHEWEREVQGGIKVARGDNWGGKGMW